MDRTEALLALNAQKEEDRLAALRDCVAGDVGGVASTPRTDEVNNHVHTRYSFSPYSPSAAVWAARCAGLSVVGSVDHDSISAAAEMQAAGAIAGIGVTVGAELRVSFGETAFAGRRLNNPDTLGNAYIVLHGVPRASWDRLAQALEPIHQAREARNREQLSRLNALLPPGIEELEYDRDVRSLSWAERGGSVTERHLLLALALSILGQARGSSETIVELVEQGLGVPVSATARQRIGAPDNPHLPYDLIGLLKAHLVPAFFVQPDSAECPPVREITALAADLGAIPAYAYLGDVQGSVTGDKKDQSFEDAYLEELFAALPHLGFQAVTYMPPRNTRSQLMRVQKLCVDADLMEISGVDINSSRQSFNAPEVLEPPFRHLTTSTWALVGHEVANGAEQTQAGLFGKDSPVTGRPLAERIVHFFGIGHGSQGMRDGDAAAGVSSTSPARR